MSEVSPLESAAERNIYSKTKSRAAVAERANARVLLLSLLISLKQSSQGIKSSPSPSLCLSKSLIISLSQSQRLCCLFPTTAVAKPRHDLVFPRGAISVKDLPLTQN